MILPFKQHCEACRLVQWHRVGFGTNADRKFWFEYGQIILFIFYIILIFGIVLGSLFSIECFTHYFYHILI